MRQIVRQAPAKVNLHLGIYDELDKRRYHRADSLMVALDLYDRVEVCAIDVGGLSRCDSDDLPLVECVPSVDVPAHKNTVYRAAWELANRFGREPRVSILVRKIIPDQAGMGGSSSDAAAVILALCDMWDIDHEDERVVEAACAVGADVPFFLDPVPTLLTGAGDIVARTFASLATPIPVALVRPAGAGVSTPVAYAEYDKDPSRPESPDALCKVLAQDCVTPKDVAACLYNNLGPVACRLLPQVGEVSSWLAERSDVLGAQVTGSGSCVFAICANDADARRVVNDAARRFDAWTCATHMV